MVLKICVKLFASALYLYLHDKVINVDVDLHFTIFSEYTAIAGLVHFVIKGSYDLHLLKAMSLNLDLPYKKYEFVHLDGAWAKERNVNSSKLVQRSQEITCCCSKEGTRRWS